MDAASPDPEPRTGERELRPVSPAQDQDDALCWIRGAAVIDRHCKIVCPRCGFTRDCSDP